VDKNKSGTERVHYNTDYYEQKMYTTKYTVSKYIYK